MKPIRYDAQLPTNTRSAAAQAIFDQLDRLEAPGKEKIATMFFDEKGFMGKLAQYKKHHKDKGFVTRTTLESKHKGFRIWRTK